MKTRILHTKVWKDKFFVELTPTEKLFFIYLLTNERVNIIHCYELTEREIQFDTGIDTPTIKGMKKKLQEKDKIFFHKDWIYLRNASKYESYSGSKNERAKQKIEQEMCAVVYDWYINIKDTPIDTPIHTLYKSETINHKSETINKKTKINKNKKIAKDLLGVYNDVFNSQRTSIRSFEKNLKYWLEDYTTQQIEKAIRRIKQLRARDEVRWLYEASQQKGLEVLFRQRDSNGNACDWVGMMLDQKTQKQKLEEMMEEKQK